MRLSSFRTVRIAPGLAVPLVTLLLACGEAPTDPTGLTEGLPVAAGHIERGQGHGRIKVKILQQPVVSQSTEGICSIDYTFEMERQGGQLGVPVRWSTYWWGGDHDGDILNVGEVATLLPGTPVVVSASRLHFDHGHSFDAVRIVVTAAGKVLGQKDTEGRTVSCS
jgi:hypothetical protein